MTHAQLRILLNYSLPPVRNSRVPLRENYAPTLIALFKTISFLIILGYPKHWFELFLQTLISNKLRTSEKFPENSPNEHACWKEEKYVDLSPFLLELKVLTTLYEPVLGLGIQFFYKQRNFLFIKNYFSKEICQQFH